MVFGYIVVDEFFKSTRIAGSDFHLPVRATTGRNKALLKGAKRRGCEGQNRKGKNVLHLIVPNSEKVFTINTPKFRFYKRFNGVTDLQTLLKRRILRYPKQNMSLPTPYTPISQFYVKQFGCKVQKIPVSVADTCPNRMGLKGMKVCSFCDVWGSAAYPENREKSLAEQIEENRVKVMKKLTAPKFLVYFQAYTNTFTKLQTLKNNFDVALQFPDVAGMVVGTRPDCLSKGVLDLWQEYHEKSFVAVELGVQAFYDDQLEFLSRGHTAQDSIKAIHKIASTTNVNLGIHLMFGIPGETDQTIVETAKIVNDLPIHNVKLHNLHVLKDTDLEKLFLNGEFSPIEKRPYAERVRLFLQHLRPDIYVHRLAALSSRWEECLAPEWTKQRMRTHQFIIDVLNENQSYQGQFFPSNRPSSVHFDATKETEWLVQKSTFPHSTTDLV